MTGTLSSGQVAKRSGFSLDTLRYYERIGLLQHVERTSSGHRRFGEDDLEWLEVLRCLRDTGMPIAQMRRYAEAVRDEQATVEDRLALLIDHDRRVRERITVLQTQHEHIQGKIAWYRSQLAATAGPPRPDSLTA